MKEKLFFISDSLQIAFRDVAFIEPYPAGLVVITKNSWWSVDACEWANNAHVCKDDKERFIKEWHEYIIEKEKGVAK